MNVITISIKLYLSLIILLHYLVNIRLVPLLVLIIIKILFYMLSSCIWSHALPISIQPLNFWVEQKHMIIMMETIWTFCLSLNLIQLQIKLNPMMTLLMSLQKRCRTWLEREIGFTPLILKLLKEGACYHKGIPLAKCEDRNKYLYF